MSISKKILIQLRKDDLHARNSAKIISEETTFSEKETLINKIIDSPSKGRNLVKSFDQLTK